MITGILFAVFIVTFVITGGIGIWLGSLYFRSKASCDKSRELKLLEDNFEDSIRWVSSEKERDRLNQEYLLKKQKILESVTQPKHKGGFLVSTVLAVTLLLGLIMVPGSFHQVEAGTVAVVKELGRIVEVRTPGTYFDFYMTRHYDVYDATVQQVEIKTAAYSKDGQTMDLEVYLQYQIQLDKLIIRNENGVIQQTEGIAGKYVTLDSLQARIQTQTIEKTKAVMSSAEAMVIIQDRQTYSELVSTTVRNAIGSDYYVNVQDVVLTNIDFTDEFEKSVEDKVVAEQQKQASITRAEAELEVAKLEAQKKIEEARGNAEAQKIIAQATAEAATYKIIELAKSIGYIVNETYVYSVDGLETEFTTKQIEDENTIYLSTKYVIDITSGPGTTDFKPLVEDYLKYLAYLEQWNGELPQVVAGDDAVSILVP